MIINAAIIDDDTQFLSSFAKTLDNAFKQLDQHATISLFDRPEKLMESLADGNIPDVIFCDILLPESQGVALSHAIQYRYPQIKIIFVSAVLENAKNIFGASPTYFLLKPIDEKYLLSSISLLVNQMEKDSENLIALPCKSGAVMLHKNLLEYVEINNRTLVFHEADKVITTRLKLDDVETALGNDFLRCHKSFLVNINYIRNLKGNTLILFSGAELPISRSKLTKIKDTFFSLAHKLVDAEVHKNA